MPRITTSQVPGQYKLTHPNGQILGYYQAQSFYERLTRGDPVNGQRDGEWIHPTDYSASKETQIGPNGRWKDTYGYVREGNLYGAIGIPTSLGYSFLGFDTSIANAAINKARSELVGQGFNLLQNIAERQQAIDLISDRLTSIYRSYRAARSKRWKEAFRHLGLHNRNVSRRLSENVLAWNYGVSPLIDDVDTAVDMWRGRNDERIRIIVMGKEKSGDVSKKQWREVDYGGVPFKLNYGEQREARCMIVATPANEALIKAAALRVNNPALLAWELIPFSFLVDWVLPIGEMLDAVGATAGWNFYSGYLMERSVCEYEYGSAAGNNQKTDLTGKRRMFQFRRTRLTSFPMPGWSGLKNPFSLMHALNAVALYGAGRRSKG